VSKDRASPERRGTREGERREKRENGRVAVGGRSGIGDRRSSRQRNSPKREQANRERTEIRAERHRERERGADGPFVDRCSLPPSGAAEKWRASPSVSHLKKMKMKVRHEAGERERERERERDEERKTTNKERKEGRR
jgi:hypothetical protein